LRALRCGAAAADPLVEPIEITLIRISFVATGVSQNPSKKRRLKRKNPRQARRRGYARLSREENVDRQEK
jgi:hypothetical protein